MEMALLNCNPDPKNPQKMRELQTQYTSSVEQSLQGIALVKDFSVFFANAAFSRMVCSEKKILNCPLEKALASIHPEDRTLVLQRVQECIEGAPLHHVRVRTTCTTHERSVDIVITPVHYCGEDALQLAVTEIPEHTQEEPLPQREEQFKNLFELLPDGVVTLDMKGIVTSCNTATEILTGVSKDEIVGTHISKLGFLRARDIPTYIKIFASIVRGHIPDLIEVEWRHRDGTPRTAEIRVRLLKEKGTTVGLLVVTRDTTERKKAEEQLRESEEKYRNIVELAPDGILTFNLKGVVTSCNTAYLKLTGYSQEDIVGNHFTKLPAVLLENVPKYVGLFASLLKGKVPEPFEFSWIHKDGTTRQGEAHISLMKMGKKISGFQAVTRDITERKQAEKALQAERDKLKALFEGLDRTEIGIDIVGIDYRILVQNEVLRKEFGDLTGTLCYQAYLGFEEPCSFCPMVKAVEHNTVESAQFVDIHGRHMELISAPLPNPDGTVDKAIEVAIDNTERIKAEKALRESEMKFRNLFEESRDAIIINSREGAFFDVNQAALTLFGYTREAMMGLNAQVLYADPADRFAFQQELEKKGSVRDFEVKMRKKDGTVMDCLLTSSVWRAKDGSILGYDGIIRDITEKKQIEEQIKASLREKEVLLQEIHHRVKNNLQIVSSLLNLQSAYIKDAQYREMFRESQDRIRSMALVHSQLYRSENLAEINFNEYISTMVYSLFRSYGVSTDRIGIRINVDSISLGIGAAIPCGLIINELVSNSLKHAFPERRKGEIAVELRSSDGIVVLTVRDNGVGIADRIDSRNTETLGLRLVTILAEGQLQGTITLERDGGTAFCITFKEKG
jgi:PAS domain S-box-containing protein